MAVYEPSCTPTALIAATDAVAVPTMPALPVNKPCPVTAPENVFAPAKVCVPVLTVPRKEASASGIFRFIVEDERLYAIAALVFVIAGV